MSEAGDWADLFRRIAVPRLPGSEAQSDIEAVIAERLARMGYAVSRDRFLASDRSLVAASVAGAGLGWIALLISPFLSLGVSGWPVALIGFGALALTGLLAFGLYRGQLRIGVREVSAVNISAVRGTPRLWLVAHSDSKAQGVSLAGRIVAVLLLSLGTTWIAVALCARLFTVLPWWLALPGAAAAMIGGGALSRGSATNESPGAVDNATGVIAALCAAERLSSRSDVGVLVTGAEEYGMVGARVWSNTADPDSRFINFDGIDSRGALRVVIHLPARGHGSGSAGHHLASTIHAQLAALGYSIRRRLPPGVLVDGVALARGGMTGVTLSRGDWHTARVVHTARDSVERVSMATVLEVGWATAAAVEQVLG